jgi:hypothetical protein
MTLKKIALTGCLTAGLLLSSSSWSTAHADTTLSLQKQGSGVTVTGVYTQNSIALGGTPALVMVKDSNGRVIHADQTTTDKDGRYTFRWTMPASAADGTYIAEVHISGDVELSSFVYSGQLYGSGAVLPVDDGAYRFTGELNSGAKQALVYDSNTGLTTSTAGNATTATVDAARAINRITSASFGTTYLTISVPANSTTNSVKVPGSVLRQAQTSLGSNAHVLVATKVGSIDLPLSAVYSGILDSVKNASDGALTFTIKQVDNSRSNALSGEYNALGVQPMLLPVEFGLEASYNGQRLAVQDFGNQYVRCSLDLTGAYLTEGAVQSAQFLQPQTNKLVPTPSSLFRDAIGHGKIVVSRTGTGLYVPIQNQKSFDDTTWSASASKIHYLASKAVVSGKTAGKFDPFGPLTRAEFSTLMVRALGLSDKQGSSRFYDVPNGQWFTDYVNIGSSLGLIAGYSPSEFAPNDSITREQMAALLARSLTYVQNRPYVDTTRVLGQISDSGDISGWAREDVALAVQTGILPSTGRLDPQRPASRSESVDMLYNMLSYLKFL